MYAGMLSCGQEYPEPILQDDAKRPVLENIDPQQVQRGEIVSITGRHLAEGAPSVRIGAVYALVVFVSADVIRFRVPDVPDGPYAVEVYNIHGGDVTEQLLDVLRE